MALNSSARAVLQLAAITVLAASVVGCRGGGSPTSPVPDPPSSSAPSTDTDAPPVTASGVLAGRVTETLPTTSVEVYPASLKILDGPDAGMTASADEMGMYAFPKVHTGTWTVEASAPGFESSSRKVTVGTLPQPADFQLAKIYALLSFDLKGTVPLTAGTCSDGAAQASCVIVAFPVHHAGPIDARLTWTPLTGVDLTMALFETKTQRLLALPDNANDPSGVHVRGDVSGSQVYELHITRAKGTIAADYSLALSYPN